jgi:putative flippase GtrA
MPRGGVVLIARYGLVGVVNTLSSLAVITALDIGLRAPPALANAAGYGVGVAISYVLNRRFVFASRDRAGSTGPRYLLAVGGGFLLNQWVLYLALRVLGAGAVQHLLAQVAAMAVYTVSVFLACRYWVFRPSSP